jgi:hypothetical protein
MAATRFPPLPEIIARFELPDEPVPWAEATPEVIEASFQRALATLALDILSTENEEIRVLVARDWQRVTEALRERWQRAAEKMLDAAQADMARQRGQLQ